MITRQHLVNALTVRLGVYTEAEIEEALFCGENQFSMIVEALNSAPRFKIVPNINHLMLDIETMDNIPTAAITGIAGRFFDPLTGQLGKSFRADVSLESSMKHNLTLSAGTILWWLKQSDDARAQFENNHLSPSLDATLQEFFEFVKNNSDKNKLEVWGNGSVFDCTITENAYRAVGIACPWEFYQARDVRTVVSLGQMVGVDFKKSTPFVGTVHDPLDDVDHQIKYTVKTIRHLVGLPND